MVENLARQFLKIDFLLIICLASLGTVRLAEASGIESLAGRPIPISAATATLGCDQPVRVMPVGDSITRGSSSGTPVEAGYYISYRRDLYRSLAAQGFRINFVGSRKDDGGYYPDFDRDHEGWSGKRGEEIAANIYNWLAVNPADILLLHIGTNDMSLAVPDTSPADMEQILNEVDRFDPNIWVIVARIIQRSPYDPDTTMYNDNVAALLAGRINAGDRLRMVDMENGAGLVYSHYPAGDMSDDRHPYATGYAKMAAQWEQVLKTLLPACGCAAGSATGQDNRGGPAAACRWTTFLPAIFKNPFTP